MGRGENYHEEKNSNNPYSSSYRSNSFTTIVSAASGDITVVSREDGSGTRGAFVELFGIEEEKDGEKVDMTTDEAV